MTENIDSAPRARTRIALLYDPRFRSAVYQAIMMVLIVGVLWWLWNNVTGNLARAGRGTGFGFLSQTAGFNISFSLIPYERASTYLDVYFVGILNTLLVASIGVVLATVVGFSVGIARLSPNFLISRFAALYIEIVRNIPLLLQLIFWYFLLLNALPGVRQSIELPGGIVVNQRGLYFPRPVPDDQFGWVVATFAVSVLIAFLWRRYALRRKMSTGEALPIWPVVAGLLIVPLAVVWLISGSVLHFDYPELRGFNYGGGFTTPPELNALVFGLVIYTSAFIAETVRAGIQAVSRGQIEAAEALGIKPGDRLRLVVIPQAMRIIVPPLTSQYLNLTKNSSLGAAIAFPELVNIFAGTALNQSGRAIEVIAMTMLVYLTFSLLTSAFMNWYNARVALVER